MSKLKLTNFRLPFSCPVISSDNPLSRPEFDENRYKKIAFIKIVSIFEHIFTMRN